MEHILDIIQILNDIVCEYAKTCTLYLVMSYPFDILWFGRALQEIARARRWAIVKLRDYFG